MPTPFSMPEQPVVEVVADLSDVVVVCHRCPDDRRLPYDDLALRVGVSAFLDEHADCGPVRIRLPLDQQARTPARV